MISVLFLIAGIHSTTKFKTYEQAKNFFNPANTQSSSEESYKRKSYTFIGMCSLFTWFNLQILNLCHRWHRRIHIPLKYLKWSLLRIWLTARSRYPFSQNVSSQMFYSILNTLLDDTSTFGKSSKCVLFWKSSIFTVVPVIRDQSKTKTILHIVFEAFIGNNSRYKTQRVSWWVLWVGDARNINFFIKNHY